jgi:dipeptidyl aminopeptidase/acylaminoacyl peptidase
MRTLIVVLFFALAAPATAQDRRAMTTDDGLNMVRVGGAVLSPDGSWLLFSKSELDWEKNKRKTSWWKAPLDGSEPYRFIGEEGGASFRFSPAGGLIAFKRNVKDTAQIFLIRTDGGEAYQLSKHATAVGSFEWSEDGARIFFVASEPRSDEEKKARKNGADAIFVDEGPNGQGAGSWTNLWVIDVKTREERRLTEADQRVGSFSVSPDGGRVVYASRTENRRNQSNLSEIHLLDVASATDRRLTHNEAPEGRFAWAPDGRRFAYGAPSDEAWELRLEKLWVMDADGGDHRMISGAFNGNIRSYAWTPDGTAILFGGLHGTNTNLYRLEVATGAVRKITDAIGTLSPTSFSRDRSRMAYVYQDFDTPPDIWVGPTDGSPGERVTHANPWVEDEIALGQWEVIRWKSSDGTEIEGVLMMPDGQEGARGLPLLLHVHGGPAGVFTNSFSSRNHVWAGLGYAQLFPNVRGSSGYTDELLRGNMHDIGDGDYEDLMTGVDEVVARGIADPDHLGIRGWSYGGILGGWTITQTDRFRGASLGAMVTDWTSEYGPGFNYDVRLWYIGGTPWEKPEEWRRRSSLTHVADVVTPTLLLHGMNDRTDTEPQSMMFFQALKDLGKTVRYIRFPREPHGFREPRHQRTRDVEEIRWIQKYVRGIDWTPWERPKPDEKPKVVS